MTCNKKPASIAIAFMISSLSCNLEVNTVDPQTSANINMSKQNGFFISEFSLKNLTNAYFEINEAWTEYIWFNKIRDGKVVKEKINHVQLSFKIDSFLNKQFNKNDYITDWIMKDAGGAYVGKSNGVFTLTLKGNVVPDSIVVYISKFRKDHSQEDISQFQLIKKE